MKLCGPVPHAQIAEWMAAADYVCQPTDGEAFGQAVLEAMACERSVLATTRGGPPEFVPREAGVLVDPTEEGEIERGLREMARLPDAQPGRARPLRSARRARSGPAGSRRSFRSA